ncbi:MAG: SusC/RagA family TonB-linked outer membrane protein [Reichenbachiella sp.]
MEDFYNSLMKRMPRKGIRLLGMVVVLFSVLISSTAMAQSRTVNGTVTDGDDGSTLPGVNILIKGTTNGAVTDFDGNYSVVVGDDAVLVYSFVGYQSKEIIVGSRSAINIEMELDAEQLTEVVVIGYGSVEKKDVTGVVTSVDSKQFNKGVIGSPDKLLNGKVAGLQMSSGGDPGSTSNVRIRGANLRDGKVLYVVDGVPLDQDGGVVGQRNPLNFINPNDVENITVLKDASAAAIYGSRGANGVIIITTKTGEQGKMKVSYDGYYTFSKFSNQKVPIYDAETYRKVIIDKQPQEFENLGDANTDWVDEVLQVAQGMQHNLSVSGGGKSNNYFASVNYLDNQGVMRKTSNQTTSLSLKFNQKLFNDALKIGITSKSGFVKDQYSPNVIGAALSMDPTRPVYDETSVYGGYYQWSGSGQALATSNPVADQDLNDQQGKSFRTLNSLELNYRLPFIEGLSVTALGSYNYTYGEYNSVASELLKSRYDLNRGVGIVDEDETKTTALLETYLKYVKRIESIDTKIDLIGGYSWQEFRHEQARFSGDSGIQVNDEWQIGNITFTDSIPVANRLISFYGRANVDIKGKYLLTMSLRKDGSTRFGPSNRWGFFPAAAVAWRIIEEPWMQWSAETFSDLKLRVGYGVTGNQDFENYQYSTYYFEGDDFARYQFGDTYYRTLRPDGVDPDIRWEETVSTNYGIDAGFLDGRLNMSAEYYIKDVDKLLYEVAVPAGTNLSDIVYTNIGKVRNQGFELSLDAVAVDRENFTWNLAYNLSTNKNEVLKLDNSTFNPTFNGYDVGDINGDVGQRIQVLKVGEPINAFKVYEQLYDESGVPIYSANPIDMYKDQLTIDSDGDGILDTADGLINDSDKLPTESPYPSLMMGLTSNMNYKNFDFSFTMRANFGNYMYNNNSSSMGYFDRLTETQVTNNIHESAYETGFKTRQLHSSHYLEDASFLKLDNITLGYNFSSLKFAKIRAYVTAQNIMTITGYSGIDPESFSGIDNNPYPRSMTFIGGLSVNF